MTRDEWAEWYSRTPWAQEFAESAYRPPGDPRALFVPVKPPRRVAYLTAMNRLVATGGS